MDMSKYLAIFVSEAQEHLQRMDELVLTLERTPQDATAIAALFREAHSMKGMSASMGFEGMAAVAHRLEDFLDRCRTGQSRIEGEALEVLFAGVDLLRQAVAEAGAAGAPLVDVTPFLEQLSARLQPAPAARGGGAGERPNLVAELLAGAPHSAFGRPDPVYAIQVDIAADTPMPSARAYITVKRLGELGELLDSLPTPDQLQAGEFQGTLAVLLASERPPGTLHRTVSGWPDVASVSVEFLADALAGVSAAGAGRAAKPAPSPAGPAAGEAAGYEPQARPVPAAPQETASTEVHRPPTPEPPRPAPGIPPAEVPLPALAGARAETPPVPLARGEVPAAAPARGEAPPLAVARGEQVARVDTRLLDQLVDQVGELITAKGSLLEESRAVASPGLREAIQRVERLVGFLQRQALKLRMMPFEMIADRFPRAVRDLARKGGKEVEFRLLGKEIELDRSILDHLSDPLLHILRNAIDHGIEPPGERERLGKPRAGTLHLRAAREGESVYLQIEDDGRGMDPDQLRQVAVRRGVLAADQAAALSDEEALELITRPGFSTAEQVTDVSGRGVGMDVVKTVIEGLHGSLLIESAPGEGTTFTLRLPVSLAVISVLLVRVGGERYAIPMYQVGTTVEVVEEAIQRAQGQEAVALAGELIPLLRLGRALGAPANGGPAPGAEGDGRPAPLYAVLTEVRGRDVGVLVDGIVGVQDVLVKPLGKALRGLRGFAGVTILGDGRIVLILDLNGL